MNIRFVLKIGCDNMELELVEVKANATKDATA
jgi:hypothetical protein